MTLFVKLKRSQLQSLVTKVIVFFAIILSLLLTNLQGNDYFNLNLAYLRQQESYGMFFIYMSKLFYSLDLDYIYLHSAYLLILSFCVAAFTRNPLYIVLFIIVYGGAILNEQTRFYTAAFFTLFILMKVKRLWGLSIIGGLMHPAGFLLSSVCFFFANLLRKVGLKNFYILIPFLIVVSIFLPKVMLEVSGALGYGYIGTKFLEPISGLGYLFIVLSVAVSIFLIYFSKAEQATNQYLLMSISLLSLMFSSFAIVSGRLLLLYVLLFVSISKPIPIISKRNVNKCTNYLNFINLLFLFIVFIVFSFKSS